MSQQPEGAARAFDVAVVGAGPAGSITARRLATAGCKVVLVERSRFEAPRIGESLAPGTQPLLREAGVWRNFLKLDLIPSSGTRSFWGSTTPQVHSHIFTPYGSGWHVDRVEFDNMLARSAAQAGAELVCGAVAKLSTGQTPRGWSLDVTITSPDGRAWQQGMRAGVLVDATGRSARIARSLGTTPVVFDRLVGVACGFLTDEAVSPGFILIEAEPGGWWYSAPLPGGRLIVAFLTDGDLLRTARLAEFPRWEERLAAAAATSERVAGNLVWGPKVYSAMSQRLHRIETDRAWIAVGDAGLSVDPISGSGVVRALRSAEAAAENILAYLETGDNDDLAAYEADRDLECNTYLHERAQHYRLERRWPDSTFWSRRHGVS